MTDSFRIPFRRGRCRWEVNIPTTKDVNDESMEVWMSLPSKIRNDPTLASFQKEHKRTHRSDQFSSIDADENENNAGEKCEPESIPLTPLKKNQPTIVPMDQSKRLNAVNAAKEINVNCILTNTWQKNLKIISLFVIWFVFTAILSQTDEKQIHYQQQVIPKIGPKYFSINQQLLSIGSEITMNVDGPFMFNNNNLLNDTNSTIHFLSVTVEAFNQNTSKIIAAPQIWKIPLNASMMLNGQYDGIVPVTKKQRFDINHIHEQLNRVLDANYELRIKFETNSNIEFGIRFQYDLTPLNINVGVIFAAIILFLMYGMIIFEIVHRTFAAIVSSVMAIGCLAILDDRPTMAEIIIWLDIQTLLLLFSMMILIGIITETGIFDYVAVYAFKITGGRIWPLIHCLCIVTALVSTCLDNVTTALLMLPVAIRLCEVIELNPIPVLMAVVMHANIGGTITPIGDPPNIMITTNDYIHKHGVSFYTFCMHMSFGVVLVIIQTAIHLRIYYRDIHTIRTTETTGMKDMRREIMAWKRALDNVSTLSCKGGIVRKTMESKIKYLEHQFTKMELSGIESKESYRLTLAELKQKYPIKNKILLGQTMFTLAFIIILFFIQSVPEWHRLSLGWCALLGVIMLLIISGKNDMDAIMHRMQWKTLLFFGALFVTMESLDRLGLVAWIGVQCEQIILSVPQASRLSVAIITILWVSAMCSAFVDTIPVTAVMIKIVVSLASNPAVGLPLQPLVWALAFGPCLGSNGTLYGATANVMCGSIAEQHGYKLNFMDYLKICFPIMIGSVLVTTGYLLIAHTVFEWH